MHSQSDRDARIRDRAYQIWDREGRRHGRHEAHWQQAKREIDAEETGTAGAQKAPARSTRAKKTPVTSEASPPTVSRAQANDGAEAKKSRTRAATAANTDTGPAARSKTTTRRDGAKT
jgi:hypothetical protein